MRPRVALLLACLLSAVGCSAAASSSEPASGSGPTTSPPVPVVVIEPPPTEPPPAPAPPTTAPAPAPASPSPELIAALEQSWSRVPARSCLMVLEGGRVLYERNPDMPLLPASTQKLLTAAAVLANLPADARFHTPVLAAAAPREGVVTGDLYLVGTGDPSLVTAPYLDSHKRRPSAVTSMELLADRVVAAGVRHVTGSVLADDSRFDDQRTVASWPARYLADGEIGTLSALMVDDGMASWEQFSVPFPDAAVGAAQVLVDLLRQRGVQIDGEAARARAPAGSVEVAGVDSPTTAELVADMIRESDNTTAELLVKELGRRVAGSASTGAGMRVVVDTLRAAGVPVDGLQAVDGSGLSRENQLTCRTLVATLARMPAGDAVDAGLPVAASTGTLWKRMAETPAAGLVRAKTGSILQVMSLAGRAPSPSGQRTFAFVLNDLGNTLAGKVLQDEVAVALVTR